MPVTLELPTFDWITLQKQAAREFGARVAAITDWSAPTPDTEWCVRDLVRHIIVEQQWIPPLLAGLSVLEAKRSIAPLGPDLAAEWETHSALADAAWAATPAGSPVNLSYDTVTASDYLREQVSDVTIHAWDLARATGADETLDILLVEAVWTVFEPQKDTLQASGLFASPIGLDDNAPLQSRLLALTGRDDRR